MLHLFSREHFLSLFPIMAFTPEVREEARQQREADRDWLALLKGDRPSTDIAEEVEDWDRHNAAVEGLRAYIESGQRHPQYSQTRGKDVDAVILQDLHLDEFPIKEAEMTLWGSIGSWVAFAAGVISGTSCVFILLIQRQEGKLIVTRDVGAVGNYLPSSVRHKGEKGLMHGRLVTAFFADGIPARRLHDLAVASLARTRGKTLIERQMDLLQISNNLKGEHPHE